MKKIISIAIFVVVYLISNGSDSTFTINGKFDKLKSGKIFLTIFSSDNTRRDSAVIKAGKFIFTGTTKDPVFASLTIPSKRNDFFTFYLEPVKMSITGDGDSLKLLSVKGSALNDDDKFLIKAIPSNLLLDKEGNIIAKNLFGKKLSDKLSELLP